MNNIQKHLVMRCLFIAGALYSMPAFTKEQTTKNPFTELRRIITEQGNISRQQLEALANTMAPAPANEVVPSGQQPTPQPKSPFLYNQSKQSDQSTDDPYLFGLDKRTHSP